MPSFLDYLTNGNTPPASTQSTVKTDTLPDYYTNYQQALFNNAAAVGSEPYQSYGGPRIAPVNGQQTQAFDFLGQNAGNWQQPLDQAQAGAEAGAGGFNRDTFENNYMSPYTQDVAQNIQRLGMQNLNENLLPALNDNFIGSGQFGSQRNFDTAGRLIRDTGANIAGQQAGVLNSGFNSAMQNYNTGTTNQTNAAQTLGGLSQMQSGLTTQTAGALEASGATQRGMDQSNLDLGYQDFLNQQQYPKQNLNFLNSIMTGQQLPNSTSSTTTGPYQGSMSPSPLAQFGAALNFGAGVSQQNQPPKPVARGGLIRYAMGGGVRMPSSRIPLRARFQMAEPRGGLQMMAA